ncbi:MAG: hypothetical protein ABF504_13520, partial [Komagataeibacter saccharivorans]|uniref:hypothetical protein n=1 Tax=Komagataeibacter saccharivorans TaxID=265959 RepID=UPI0039E888D5
TMRWSTPFAKWGRAKEHIHNRLWHGAKKGLSAYRYGRILKAIPDAWSVAPQPDSHHPIKPFGPDQNRSGILSDAEGKR